MTTPSLDLARVVVLSPHLDDAAFSAWHAIGPAAGVIGAGAGPVVVVSVFAGVPEPGFVTALDRGHGAAESAAWVERRRREDAAVLAPGAVVVHLDQLDLQYRARTVEALDRLLASEPKGFLDAAARHREVRVSPEELARVVPPLAGDAVVYSPLGIGGHPDHMDVAAYAVGLRGQVKEVRLFADTPYYLRFGLPSWAGGAPNPAADALAEQAWAQLPGSPRTTSDPTEPTVVVLDDEAVAAKLVALQGYRTEFPAIDEDFAGVPSNLALMRHEVYWALR